MVSPNVEKSLNKLQDVVDRTTQRVWRVIKNITINAERQFKDDSHLLELVPGYVGLAVFLLSIKRQIKANPDQKEQIKKTILQTLDGYRKNIEDL